MTVAVILDSAVGLHQGGQVAAPVFQRITQQVLEYMHVPHDLQVPPNRQVWLAQNRVKDSDLDESSPDHLGSTLGCSGCNTRRPYSAACATEAPAAQAAVVPAALREKEPARAHCPRSRIPAKSETPAPEPSNGTVVLDVEQGGIEVPSFLGKSVRGAIETAQDSGLELNPVGSGIAREQTPAAGSHVTAGSRVLVKFGR